MKCPPEKIFDHFKKHFNPTILVDLVAPKELSGNLSEIVRELQKISNNFPINHEVPTIDEIQRHLCQLKSGKASNDVDPKLLKKCEHPLMLQVIHRMANNLWSDLDILAVWGNSRLKTLWTGKGSKSDPSKSRRLSTGSTVCKLIINIILERISPWYDAQLSKELNGFRTNRDTTDGIYSMKRIHQISNRKKLPLYLLFVDLTAAYDRISRKRLFDPIRLRFPEGENVKLFDILGKHYQKTSLIYQEAQVTFLVTSGVHQGRLESPCLFILYINFVMRVYMSNCTKDDPIRFFKHQIE